MKHELELNKYMTAVLDLIRNSRKEQRYMNECGLDPSDINTNDWPENELRNAFEEGINILNAED